jgi:4'-phosphopantetheinyl transferase
MVPPHEDVLTPEPWRLNDPPPERSQTCNKPQVFLINTKEDLDPEKRAELMATLSCLEKQRLCSYQLPADQERFLRGRGGLRQLLSKWTEQPAHEIEISTNNQGKPFCHQGPQFNISHSHNIILLAAHKKHAIGIDLERIDPLIDWRAIGNRMLSEAEMIEIEQQHETEQPRLFTRRWCELEAELKAAGTGFSGIAQKRGNRKRLSLRKWPLKLPVNYEGALVMRKQMSKSNPNNTSLTA